MPLTVDRAEFYVTQKLGPKRSLTPEGFLLCEDVPVARIGDMLYGEQEVALDGDGSGVIRISRTPEEVFRPETLASAQGKPVTLQHPDAFVEPGNFGMLAKGSMLNVHRGEGIQDDLMIADLLITDATAIQAVQSGGIEEVSLGYNADYEQVEPGRGVQRNIVINHCALVERGRCGPRCAIGDSAMATKGKKGKFRDMLLRAFKAKDADEVEKLAQEAEDADGDDDDDKDKDQKTADAIAKLGKSMDAKFKALDEEMAELKKKVEDADDEDDDDDKDDKDKTKDTVINAETGEKLDDAGVKLYTGDAAKVIGQRAEILAPGTKLPTFDAQTTDGQRVAALCACQRKALEQAYATDHGRELIDPLLSGSTIGRLPLAQLNAVFTAGSELLKQHNNAGGATRANVSTRDFGRPITAADVNKRNAAFWNDRSKAH